MCDIYITSNFLQVIFVGNETAGTDVCRTINACPGILDTM